MYFCDQVHYVLPPPLEELDFQDDDPAIWDASLWTWSPIDSDEETDKDRDTDHDEDNRSVSEGDLRPMTPPETYNDVRFTTVNTKICFGAR